ncbi:2OG-Fe(II) oxygenase [Sphingomonas sp. PL-96]|uniref:2OG-Fe(II) oxygenase n=1 Tax=Sphingomonas sp. PL-96 TaxID=2887201 RepID=UPI001E40A1D3|nr:2OG-Fe(II) oxygenase family protein [Sphingomonas sp. PL-96]MCC2977360.1 2OG-Fe(II) oxygenase [Sphingomonas sp. PL-96]
MSLLDGLQLNPALDWDALAREFAATGRIRIHGFLADPLPTRLHAVLRDREDWRQLINSGDKIFELDRATRTGMSAEQAAALEAAVQAGARTGFQYRYETLRLTDGDGGGTAGDAALSAFPRWLSSGAARECLRRLTGIPAIDFADGQATAYAPGDFLTGHTDEVPGKQRHAAYVYGLTPQWRTEWGGLLLFHDEDGTVRGLTPGFNTLDVFAVPQLHSVSRVGPEAAYRRYAITGWLRSARPPS